MTADIPVTVFPDDIISLDLKQADETVVEGKIKTSRPKTLTDLTYSFTATFKLSAKAAREKALAPKKVSFTGDDSAPVKAYKDYYRAVMAGDAGAMKKNLAAKSLKEFESMDAKEQEMVLEMMKMRPEAAEDSKTGHCGKRGHLQGRGQGGHGRVHRDDQDAAGRRQMEGAGGQMVDCHQIAVTLPTAR